jgi:hypothetical protein
MVVRYAIMKRLLTAASEWKPTFPKMEAHIFKKFRRLSEFFAPEW